MKEFLTELKALSDKHRVALMGNIRLRNIDGEDFLPETLDYALQDTLDMGNSVTDKSGPFLIARMERKASEPVAFTKGEAAQISRDYEGYTCPVTNRWVEGRRAHRENLKQQGCRVLEKGEREHNEKRRHEEANASIDRMVDETVNRTAQELFV